MNNENQLISDKSNEKKSINVNNQSSEKDSANIPTLISNGYHQSVRTPADKHSLLPKTSLKTDTSQTLFVKRDPVDKVIDDLVKGVEMKCHLKPSQHP